MSASEGQEQPAGPNNKTWIWSGVLAGLLISTAIQLVRSFVGFFYSNGVEGINTGLSLIWLLATVVLVAILLFIRLRLRPPSARRRLAIAIVVLLVLGNVAAPVLDRMTVSGRNAGREKKHDEALARFIPPAGAELLYSDHFSRVWGVPRDPTVVCTETAPTMTNLTYGDRTADRPYPTVCSGRAPVNYVHGEGLLTVAESAAAPTRMPTGSRGFETLLELTAKMNV